MRKGSVIFGIGCGLGGFFIGLLAWLIWLTGAHAVSWFIFGIVCGLYGIFVGLASWQLTKKPATKPVNV